MDKKSVVIGVIYEHIIGIFDSEEENQKPTLELEDLNTEFFECAVCALNLIYRKITGDEIDNLDFIGKLNKIVVQGLLDNAEKPPCECNH